jgi:hypothetical protein
LPSVPQTPSTLPGVPQQAVLASHVAPGNSQSAHVRHVSHTASQLPQHSTVKFACHLTLAVVAQLCKLPKLNRICWVEPWWHNGSGKVKYKSEEGGPHQVHRAPQIQMDRHLRNQLHTRNHCRKSQGCWEPMRSLQFMPPVMNIDEQPLMSFSQNQVIQNAWSSCITPSEKSCPLSILIFNCMFCTTPNVFDQSSSWQTMSLSNSCTEACTVVGVGGSPFILPRRLARALPVQLSLDFMLHNIAYSF